MAQTFETLTNAEKAQHLADTAGYNLRKMRSWSAHDLIMQHMLQAKRGKCSCPAF